ncbi:MAG TPA: PGPGW domain-containing protein [Mycobacteriales bacterium]|nr:PGPGW domain-containing protein [Mycobacteriales bacterium]
MAGGTQSGALRAWRDRVRRTPGGRQFLKAAVFVLGLAFVLLGVALAALPGPLTIPPILLGVWIWSSEFAWADRLLERAKRSAREAWDNAKRRPVVSALVTGSGLVALGVGLWLAARYQLVDRARDLVGL